MKQKYYISLVLITLFCSIAYILPIVRADEFAFLSVEKGGEQSFTYIIRPDNQNLQPRVTHEVNLNVKITDIISTGTEKVNLTYQTTYDVLEGDIVVQKKATTTLNLSSNMDNENYQNLLANAQNPWDFFYVDADSNERIVTNDTSPNWHDIRVTWDKDGVLKEATIQALVNMSIDGGSLQEVNATITIRPASQAIPGYPPIIISIVASLSILIPIIFIKRKKNLQIS